jgi:TPR repeat protein
MQVPSFTSHLILALTVAAAAEEQPGARSAELEGPCSKGNSDACTRLADILYEPGRRAVPQDAARALGVFGPGCTAGAGEACHFVASILAHDAGDRKDPPRAAAAFERACNVGYGHWCYKLGELHFSGLLGAKDLARAAKLYSRGCAQDMDAKKGGASCFRLASMFEEGLGVEKDPAQAIAHYSASCDLDFLPACEDLGLLFGRQKDFVRALSLLQKACGEGKGVPSACYTLGNIHENGTGTSPDTKRAIEFYKLACARAGDRQSKACDAVSRLSAR